METQSCEQRTAAATKIARCSRAVPELFQNMFQNMIGRMRLGAPRPCGITPFASGDGAAYRPGVGSCKRCACSSCISPQHVRRCVRAREGSAHAWATAAGCSSSCQSQLQSTLLMTVTVTIHSTLKNAPHFPTQRVTLNYAPQTLSSAQTEKTDRQHVSATQSHKEQSLL